MNTVTVLNFDENYTLSYGPNISPSEAVKIAFLQFVRKDFDTWNYDLDSIVISRNAGMVKCGPFIAVDTPECEHDFRETFAYCGSDGHSVRNMKCTKCGETEVRA